MDYLFFDLLRASLDNLDCLSRKPSETEWVKLYEEAQRQAIVGILSCGIERLPIEQRPPKLLLLQWIGQVQMIETRNLRVDKQTAMIWQQLRDAGLDAAVLKGQGVACEYGVKASRRQSGDIDVWVKGGYETVCSYVQRTIPTDDVAYHRFHYAAFDDTEVELHHRPTLMRNLFDDRRLKRWYDSFGEREFIYLENKGFAVPPHRFNRVFLLTHIYRHFLFEGVGLRQVMDLYFVLLNSEGDASELNLLRKFRLSRFAKAIMWLLYTKFGLKEDKLMGCGMDEKEGRFLLNEIMMTGNFGHTDSRYQYQRWFKLRHHIAHGSHLLLHYPSEVIWTPIWLIYHKVWKWRKKQGIRNDYIKQKYLGGQ